ncbi:PilN domain-containing protein [Gimesia algae]|uniref:Fimbrial assembly protein (PilN) n=1 Tax=Gimesia algae TaxID=2527971 RepID=A0A517VNF4_9PLAN|nr:PilN domain-containing protein [Gimesia algae]QDT94557.1 Fimbrial assembly protein (PilN) [Gimesia algae]
MIPEIDFLPASYREVRRRHRNRIWRRTIVLIFLTLVTLSTVRQREIQHQLQTKKEALEKRAQLMNDQLEDPTQLTLQIQQTDIRADLLAGLQLDESPAQLLNMISHALPEYVSLNEFQFTFEKVFVKEDAQTKKSPSKKTEDELPELVDLKQLQGLHARENLVINLQGISPDHLSISRYMSNLDQMGVFREIDLIQSNETMFEGQPLRVFRLRMVVNSPGMYVPKINAHYTAGLDPWITAGGLFYE